jgi:putative transposase
VWHPAFLQLGKTLDECAAKYRGFCKKYRPQPKPEKRNYWGSRLLVGMVMKGKPKKSSPGQMRLPWAEWEVSETEVHAVAQKFTQANCYPTRCQVSKSQKAQGFVKSTSVVNLNNSQKRL